MVLDILIEWNSNFKKLRYSMTFVDGLKGLVKRKSDKFNAALSAFSNKMLYFNC
jgi:hypothetical protein